MVAASSARRALVHAAIALAFGHVLRVVRLDHGPARSEEGAGRTRVASARDKSDRAMAGEAGWLGAGLSVGRIQVGTCAEPGGRVVLVVRLIVQGQGARIRVLDLARCHRHGGKRVGLQTAREQWQGARQLDANDREGGGRVRWPRAPTVGPSETRRGGASETAGRASTFGVTKCHASA